MVHPHHAQHRAEDLVPVDRHLGGDLVEETRAEEEAVLVPADLEVPAVLDQLRSLVDPLVDVPGDLVAVLGGDQRSHLGVGV